MLNAQVVRIAHILELVLDSDSAGDRKGGSGSTGAVVPKGRTVVYKHTRRWA